MKRPHPRAIRLALALALGPFPVGGGETGTIAIAPVPDDARPQLSPALATHPGGGLLVWQQGRLHQASRNTDILARRLDASGRPYGQTIVLCRAPGPQVRPRVACRSDGGCLVVWQDMRNGRDWDVYAARVASDGRVLDAGGRALARGPRSQALPAVASDGQRFAVIWQHMAEDGFYELHASHVAWRGGPGSARAAPLLYTPRQARRWLGYTPGWGWKRAPVSPARQGSRHVLGGQPRLIGLADRRWLLAWQDQANWQPGHSNWTRLAILHATADAFTLTRVTESPVPLFGQHPGVLARSPARILRATVLVTGRGGLSRFGLAAVADSSTLAWQPAPPGAAPGRWRPLWRRWLVPLFEERAVEGPAGAAWAHGRFVIAARASTFTREKAPARILLSVHDDDGRPLGTLAAFDGKGAVRDPVLAATADGLLLAFSHDAEGNGLWRIRLVRISRQALP